MVTVPAWAILLTVFAWGMASGMVLTIVLGARMKGK